MHAGIVVTFAILSTTAPALSQAYTTIPELCQQPFEGKWAGWWLEDVSGDRDWEAIKYWIVDISKINDTLYRGNFDEYHFERHGRKDPGNVVKVGSKRDVDLYYIPSKRDTSPTYPRHDRIIYFNAFHTPYRSPSDSIEGCFVGQQIFTNNINILNFSFQDKSQRNSNGLTVSIGMIDVA